MLHIIGYNYDYYDKNMYRENVEEIERMYPEIYKIVYPVVKRVCQRNTRVLSDEMIEQLTDEVYFAIEVDEKRGIENIQSDKEQKRDTISTSNSKIENNKSKSVKEETREDKRIRNPLLRDLIRILILRELLNRPFRPGRPPRPHFPGMPGTRRKTTFFGRTFFTYETK